MRAGVMAGTTFPAQPEKSEKGLDMVVVVDYGGGDGDMSEVRIGKRAAQS
jgi:hypothetical protein